MAEAQLPCLTILSKAAPANIQIHAGSRLRSYQSKSIAIQLLYGVSNVRKFKIVISIFTDTHRQSIDDLLSTSDAGSHGAFHVPLPDQRGLGANKVNIVDRRADGFT